MLNGRCAQDSLPAALLRVPVRGEGGLQQPRGDRHQAGHTINIKLPVPPFIHYIDIHPEMSYNLTLQSFKG